uniref:NADH:ubiquinone reductase (H(+)-translocating) n=1 Tax=Centrorhynchus clitorideus TaxID=2731796 RepID=A0A6M3YWN0_9BILA|nr:NADH dehydrogenase subunit 5 [Centrorhynchus clitorideus]
MAVVMGVVFFVVMMGVLGLAMVMGGWGWEILSKMVNMGGGSWSGVGVELGGLGYGMSVVVMVVFLVVLGFGQYYMVSGMGLGVFGWMVVSFVVGVEVLLLGSGLYMLLVGWEILGVVSFLLIGYYCSRSSWGGALFTMLINRLGDVGVVLMFWGIIGGWMGAFMGVEWVGAGFVAMLIASVVTKSAQVPFGGWLPLAMAAPTPVSALVHSSTLVIAGLYLGSVFSVYLGKVGEVLVVLGVATILGSAVSAAGEMDFKKVVAYSTSMHLGLMLAMAIVVSWSFMGMHMVFHAFFKSLLFIGVGFAIMVMVHDQDFRGLVSGGGVGGAVGVVMLSSIWSLVGIVGFSGWVTKDGLLEQGLWSLDGVFVKLMMVVGLAVSGVYCLKIVMSVSGQSAMKGSVVLGWGLSGSVVWVMVTGVSVVGVMLGLGWSEWGDWGLGAGVVGFSEKCEYWFVLFGWLVLWWMAGIFGGVGYVVGLEGAYGRMLVKTWADWGLSGYWVEEVWIMGVVNSVVESVVWVVDRLGESLVYTDWYFVVIAVLAGLSFVALV